MKDLKFPKSFNASSLSSFLFETEFLFKSRGERIENFRLDISTVRSCTLLGSILIYKFMHYSTHNNVFKYPKIISNYQIEEYLEKCGIRELTNTLVSNNKDHERAFKKLKKVELKNFFLYPTPLPRSEVSKANQLNSAYLREIEKFYSKYKNPSAIKPISVCLSEIVKNFWAHAVDNQGTVMAAEGNPESFNLVLADNGKGIISNLKMKYQKNEKDILKMCIQEKVTSKSGNTFHMGYGLYYVSELVKANHGILNIWSEGFHLMVSNSGQKVKKVGYWKGTIIDLKLNLQQPKGISDLAIYKGYERKLKINFGENT